MCAVKACMRADQFTLVNRLGLVLLELETEGKKGNRGGVQKLCNQKQKQQGALAPIVLDDCKNG